MSQLSFFDLFVNQLREIYSAEEQMIKGLTKLIGASLSAELKEAFTNHKFQTQAQFKRLQTIFTKLGVPATGNHCEAMAGLLKECDENIKAKKRSAVEDAALIGVAQKVEHYEIACYGTLCAYARHLGLSEIENMLQESLDEEREANDRLTKIAEGSLFSRGINVEAMRETLPEWRGVPTKISAYAKNGSKPVTKKSPAKKSPVKKIKKAVKALPKKAVAVAKSARKRIKKALAPSKRPKS